MPRTSAKKTPSVVVPVAQLAMIMAVDVRTIQNWVKAGMPQQKRGHYDVAECVQWWRENILAGKDTKATKAEQLKWWKARADAAVISTDRLRGNLIDRDELLPEWVQVFTEFRQAVLGLENRLPPLLEGLAQVDMTPVIKSLTRPMLSALARPGDNRPSPVVEKVARSK